MTATQTEPTQTHLTVCDSATQTNATAIAEKKVVTFVNGSVQATWASYQIGSAN